MSPTNRSTTTNPPASADAPKAASTVGMAKSLATSMAKWAAGGFQTLPQEIHDARLSACEGCKYHEAPRCTLCGCYTDRKAWLPHEDCPIGKWPG